jgi:hypothetical protein
MLSQEDATLFKGAVAAAEPRAVKTWHTFEFSTALDFANFLNLAPAQGAGEAFATDTDRGTIQGFYFL